MSKPYFDIGGIKCYLLFTEETVKKEHIEIAQFRNAFRKFSGVINEYEFPMHCGTHCFPIYCGK